MISGIYTAASGMLAYQTQLDVTSNNLANVNTTGFKKDTAVHTAFPTWMIRRLNDHVLDTPGGAVDLRPTVGVRGGGVQIFDRDVIPRYDQGDLQETGNPMDFALEGKGFFVIETPQGPRYTRNGNFTLNKDSELTTSQGYRVLDSYNNPITAKGNKLEVTAEGSFSVDGKRVGQINVVDFANAADIRKEGESFFVVVGNAAPQAASRATRIHQGALEGSNVNSVKEMVGLIEAMRAYEAGQKMIQMQDETLSRAVNDIARVA